MLSRRQKSLLAILKDADGWCTGTVLSKELRVTSRTVRNDIGAINAICADLVASSSQGYRISPGASLPDKLFAHDKHADREDRISFLLSKLIAAQGDVDLYDVADELFVSYQTIEKDIRHVESKLEDTGLTLVKKAERVHIQGSEHCRRKMLSRLVYGELNDNFGEFVSYCLAFHEEEELYVIKRIVYETLTKNQLSANDYAIEAISVHIGIAVNRVRDNQIIDDTVYSWPSDDGYREYLLSKEIGAAIETELGVSFPLSEICNLAYTLIGKTKTLMDGVTSETLLSHVDGAFVEMANTLLQDVKEAFGLDLYRSQDEIFVRFVYHIRDLVIRMRNHLHLRNPLQNRLKTSYPLIYEIGVFMAGRLSELLDKPVQEEEIAFLVIHVGAFLENAHTGPAEAQKLRALLICPQHSALRATCLSLLNKRLGSSLQIIEEPEGLLESKRDEHEYDLILTTVSLGTAKKGACQEQVLICPFPGMEDFRKIDDAIERIRRYRSQRDFADSTLSWFCEDLFFSDEGCQNEWDAIQKMGRRMQELGYVKESFTAQVMRRERLSSTTYGGGFAIPHSTEMDALITCIAVMICKKPLKWGKFSVSVVFLIAINREGRHSFAASYDSLAGLLAGQENLSHLYAARSYPDFIRRLEDIL